MITTNPLPSNEELLALTAVKQVAQFALTKPTTYALFLMILTQALTVGQDSKAYYINHLARVFQDDDEDPGEWLQFRSKLQTLILKQQALVQTGDMLLQDYQINQATVSQLHLFHTQE
jgi:hypothetical protein